MGPSGAGKSTLLDLLLGLIFANSGNVYIGDNVLNYKNTKYWQKILDMLDKIFFY